MANVGYDQLIGLPEVHKEYMFKVNFNAVNELGADLSQLSIYAQSSSLPSKEFNQIEVPVFGHTMVYPGKKTKHGTFDVDFRVHQDTVARDILDQWQNIITDNDTGVGEAFADYTTTVDFQLLDDKPGGSSEAEVILTYSLEQCWPATVGELSTDYSGDSNSTFSATFAYSNITEENVS